MNYISVNELKTLYPSVNYNQYSDASLDTLISYASSKVDDYVEYSFDLETITDEVSKAFVDSDSSLIIFPRKRPINSLTSVALTKGSVDVNISLTNSQQENIYTIPTTKDRIIFPIADITLQSVNMLDFGVLRTVEFFSKITYNAGYQTIPNEVKEATSLFVLDMIGKGINIVGATSISQGGISMSFSNGENKLVKEAKELLRGLKQVSGW